MRQNSQLRSVIALAALIGLAACGGSDTTDNTAASTDAAPATEPMTTAEPAAPSAADQLATVLGGMPEDMQARFAHRNPAETLAFFEIEPGMTVVEALPGGGWYSKILIPYLGESGTLVGVDYAFDMWPKFGFMSDEDMEARKTWTTTWVEQASDWGEGATVEAFVFGDMDPAHAGTADAVLMIRALHNLNRFENDGGFLTEALQDAHSVLKPGGTLGVVQHRAPADADDDWANGSRGYLKEATLVEVVEAAGFELVARSDINANPADQPGADDIVWRLPPTLGTSADNETLRAEMMAIGESDRMTLKFRKAE